MIRVTALATGAALTLPEGEGMRLQHAQHVDELDPHDGVVVARAEDITPRLIDTAQRLYLPVLALVENLQQAEVALQTGASDYLLVGELSPVTFSHRVMVLWKLHPIQQVVHASPDGILVVTREGQIRFANDTVRRMFGREGLVGSVFGFPVAVERPTQLDIITPEGIQRYIEMRASAILWEGEPCYLAALRDVSEQVRLTQELEEARRDAERANAAKNMLLMSVNHELRTPLTSIKGFASTLLADDVTWTIDEWAEFVDIILDEAVKLEELIDQLMDYSKMRSGVLSIELQPTAFSDIMTHAATTLSTLAASHDLKTSIAEGLPPVEAHKTRVGQVIVNLVSNAVKYSPPGSEVVVRAAHEGEQVVVYVQDSGPGIPPGIRHTLFEPFVRDPDSGQRGVGLGLAIAESIVQAHQGEVWVHETGATGTTLAFSLQIAKEEQHE